MDNTKSYRECLDEFDELQAKLEVLPAGDERAEVKRVVSDIMDLLIKADVAEQKGDSPERYITLMECIFEDLEKKVREIGYELKKK